MTTDPRFDAFAARLPPRSLTADIAHELSNQLGCLVLLPDLMLSGLAPETPLAQDLRQIRRAAQRINELTQHLSLLSLDREERSLLNLNGPVRQALETDTLTALRQEIPGARVVSQLEENLPPIEGGADWVSVIAANLIRNALDAHPNGSVRVTTAARTLQEEEDGWERIPRGTYVVLSVSDEGLSLSAAQRAQLFEPYFSVHTLGRRSMSGLGLAVVRQLARRQGAFLNVRTDVAGTTIEVFFPAAFSKAAAPPSSSSGDRVLVVDDREEQRQVISRILRGAGYRVYAVAGGTESLIHLENPGADLVVLDISLRRDREGLDLYGHIRSHWPSLAILLISGHPRETYTDVLGRGGDCPFLKKPFRAEDLLAATGALLPLGATPSP